MGTQGKILNTPRYKDIKVSPLPNTHIGKPEGDQLVFEGLTGGLRLSTISGDPKLQWRSMHIINSKFYM